MRLYIYVCIFHFLCFSILADAYVYVSVWCRGRKKKTDIERKRGRKRINWYSIYLFLFRVCTNIPSARGFSRMIEVNYYFLRWLDRSAREDTPRFVRKHSICGTSRTIYRVFRIKCYKVIFSKRFFLNNLTLYKIIL